MALGFHSSLVFRLLLSISILMVVVFGVGNVITVQLAQNSLAAQGERQLNTQKAQYAQQVEVARERLLRKLQPQIEMLVQFAQGPLIMRVNEVETDVNQTKEEVLEAFQGCFDDQTEESMRFHCIRTQIFQHGTTRFIASLNRTFITTAINFLVLDEDMVGIFLEDWDEVLYAGVQKNAQGDVVEIQELPEFSDDVVVVEQEIDDDGEFIGKLYFIYTTARIEMMQQAIETQIHEADQLIQGNIEERSWEITLNRFVEGILFFAALMAAISLIAIRTIIQPIRKLQESAELLARGDLNAAIDTKPRDEIGSLAHSFASMRDAIRSKISELHVANTALSQAKTRLERLLDGTKEIASAHDKLTPIVSALRIIVSEVPTTHLGNVHISFKDRTANGETGFAHFEMPLQALLEEKSATPQKILSQTHHFFSEHLFPHSPSVSEREQAPPAVPLPSGSNSSLQGHTLTIPIRQDFQELGLIQIEGIDGQGFQDEEQNFVEALSQSLAISLKNVEFTEEMAEKVRMEGELKTAAAVQQALFPKQLPELPYVEMASHFQSASETGGDWYGFMTSFKNHLFLFIGDVTGHGTPAALVTAAASATTHILEEMFYLRYTIDHVPPTPAECMYYLNKAIYESGNPNFLMTFFIACIDLQTGVLSFSNAGHNFPLLMRKNGVVKRLLNSNSRLGDYKQRDFTEGTIQLETGDILFFYTDGLTEHENPSGDMWGERRLTRFLKRHKQQTPQTIVDNLVQEMNVFCEGCPLEDDMTVVCCRVTAPFEMVSE